MAPILAMLAAAALLAAPPAAQAQKKQQESYTYRCTGKDGKRYYGSTIPRACLGMPVDQLNSRGIRVKRIDPEGEEKARLAKEAEEKRLAEEAQERREIMRRNRALLATYASEKDIEAARRRDLADNQREIKDAEVRLELLKKRRAAYEKELEFYKDGKAPEKLREDIRTTEMEIEAAEGLIASKRKEASAINARYNEDRRAYRELTGR